MTQPATRQRATLSVGIRNVVTLTAEVDVSSRGLLAITALVSSILLSTAVIVRVARRDDHAALGEKSA